MATVLQCLPPDLQNQIPNDTISVSALELAHGALPPPIFNHSLRVYVLSRWLADRENAPVSLTLLFVACILHDLGASDSYNGPQRFEIEGADVASQHCASHGLSEADSHQVWTAIALHTTAGVAERIDGFTRLVRLGVKMDFSSKVRERLNAQDYSSEIELLLPRYEVEKCLGEAVVSQARTEDVIVDAFSWPDSEKHPKASWPGILLRAALENPGHQGVNPAF